MVCVGEICLCAKFPLICGHPGMWNKPPGYSGRGAVCCPCCPRKCEYKAREISSVDRDSNQLIRLMKGVRTTISVGRIIWKRGLEGIGCNRFIGQISLIKHAGNETHLKRILYEASASPGDFPCPSKETPTVRSCSRICRFGLANGSVS